MISRALDWNFDIDHYLNRIVPPSPLPLLPASVAQWFGYRREPKKDVGNILQAFWSCVGAFCGLAVVVAVFNNTSVIQAHHPPVLIASFGASAVLEYNVIKSPLGQPRNALLGHTFSAIVGVAVTKLFLYHSDFDRLRWIAGSLACGLASAVMLLTNTVHPPGGASALLAAVMPEITAMGWYFVGLVMLGTALMLVVSLVTNNVQRQFPTYWWTPVNLRDMRAARRENIPDAKGSVEPKNGSGDMVEDEIRIAFDGIHLPSDMTVSPEEALLLERLRKRLVSGDEERNIAFSGSSAQSTVKGEGSTKSEGSALGP